jgi:hypothetical protein
MREATLDFYSQQRVLFKGQHGNIAWSTSIKSSIGPGRADGFIE